MADRMKPLWMPFRSGANALAAGADARITMETLAEGSLGRRLRQYTVTRMLINMTFELDSADDNMISVGMRFENENVALGVVDPLNDTTAEWMYWEEVKPSSSGAQTTQATRIVRDIRSQRRSHGTDQDLLLYITNGTGVSCQFNVAGRILVLLP